MVDDTHDPQLRSWVESAHIPDCDFPIQNLPLGIFQPDAIGRPRPGVAIGDFILDVSAWIEGDTLNSYFAMRADDRRSLRKIWSSILRDGAPRRDLFLQANCRMVVPAAIGDYTDFYASIHHATNVGKVFRPEQPLLPNYKHVPIAYHGRASSIVISGTPIRRPNGQTGEGHFGPSKELDYEVELGAFVGPRSVMGQPVSIDKAEQHLAGVCLVNDWSARDIQRWEYQPLGPFLGKNFATSISPWVVTMEALAPFRVSQQDHDVASLPYLRSPGAGAFDITLEAWLRTPDEYSAVRLSRASFKDMYWTLAQMLTHHTSNGCPLRDGDLIASGTISGPEPENRGCLLELTSRGKEPLQLPGGGRRTFLDDGDEVILQGYCERNGFRRIGFGECRGQVLPAHSYS